MGNRLGSGLHGDTEPTIKELNNFAASVLAKQGYLPAKPGVHEPSLLLVLQWKAFGFMLLGIGLGFWVGLLPGLGGATTLALMLPFIYTMQPVEAFAFLLGMHAVVATTGDITSVLYGLPGEATSAATVVDGYAMTRKGEAGRALGAALAS